MPEPSLMRQWRCIGAEPSRAGRGEEVAAGAGGLHVGPRPKRRRRDHGERWAGIDPAVEASKGAARSHICGSEP